MNILAITLFAIGFVVLIRSCYLRGIGRVLGALCAFALCYIALAAVHIVPAISVVTSHLAQR